MSECEHPRGCCRKHAEFYEERGRAGALASGAFLSSRDALAEALAEHRWAVAYLSDGDCACGWKSKRFQASTPWDQHRAHQADMLLASGVVATPDVYPLTVAVTQVLGAVDSVLARDDYTVESDVIPTWLHCELDNLRALAASQNALADAWDEGYLRGTLDNESDLEPADNPYRETN